MKNEDEKFKDGQDKLKMTGSQKDENIKLEDEKLEIENLDNGKLANVKIDGEKSNAKNIKAEKASVFTKEQILSSRKYVDRQDIINVILEENKSYSLIEVDTLIDKFMKGKVE